MAIKDEIPASYRISVNAQTQTREATETDGAETDPKSRSDWDKYVYTLCIFMNNLAFGMTASIFYPTMVDMKYIFNTSMKNVSLSNTFGSIGYLVGSLFGFFYKRLNRQLTLVILLVAISVAICLMPFAPQLAVLYLCAFVVMLGGGAWNAANGVWLIEIWQHSSPAVLQFSQFMYGMGCILAPLLVKPYLTGELSPSNSTISPNTTTTLAPITTTDINESVDRRALLRTPFIIDGSIQLIIPIVLLVMFFVKRYQYKKPIDRSMRRKSSVDNLCDSGVEFYGSQNTDTSNIVEISSSYIRDRRLNVILIATFLATYTAIELAHFGYSATYYQFVKLRLSASESAEIFSVMASSFTIGRCISAFIAIKLKPKIMIGYHFFLIACALIVLYVGQTSDRLIWIGNIILGFGFSAVFPAIFAFAEQNIKISDKISTILIFSSASLALFTPFILGPLLENNSLILLEFEIVFFIASVLMFVVILFVIKPV